MMNNSEQRVQALFEESLAIKVAVLPNLVPQVAKAIALGINAIERQGKIMACGNGGSAADSQHFVAELLNRFERERPPMAAIALTTDTSTLTSIGNDYDYRQIFSKQVQGLARPEDVLLAISTSGQSPNVIAAIEMMHQKGGRVIALTGKEGGAMAKMLRADDVLINVPTAKTARIQEVHIMVLHALCDGLDEHFYPRT